MTDAAAQRARSRRQRQANKKRSRTIVANHTNDEYNRHRLQRKVLNLQAKVNEQKQLLKRLKDNRNYWRSKFFNSSRNNNGLAGAVSTINETVKQYADCLSGRICFL